MPAPLTETASVEPTPHTTAALHDEDLDKDRVEARLFTLTASMVAAMGGESVDEAAAGMALNEMEGLVVDRALLKSTGAGRVVNDLAKARCGLSARARSLVANWRDAVVEARAASEA